MGTQSVLSKRIYMFVVSVDMMQALLLSSLFSVLVFTMHFPEVLSSQGSELVSSAGEFKFIID